MPMATAQAPREVLDRALESAGADSFDLPPLVDQHDGSPSWLERLMKWIQSFFPKPDPNAHAGQFLPIFLKGIAILGAIMIVVAIVSLLVSYYRKAARMARDGRFGLQNGSGGPQ